MPPKAEKVANQPAETTTSAAPLLITQEQLQFLLQGMQTLQNEVRTATPSSSNEIHTPSGNFAKCTSRSEGTPNSSVEAFIDAVQVYKDCTQVSDTNALKGLAMLFIGQAAVWWQGVKSNIATWKDAIDALQHAFGTHKPAFQIYREIFAQEQNEGMSTDIFISNARALFSQLQEKPSESMQLDMLYGLLHRKIRKRIPRHEVDTFDDLIEKARPVERLLKESQTIDKLTESKLPKDAGKYRLRCSFCKNFGHDKDVCKKRQSSQMKKEESPASNAVNESKKEMKSVISCYGCGSPGVIRSQCTTCKKNRDTQKPQSNIDAVEFYTTAMEDQNSSQIDNRPALHISVYNKSGIALMDTGAKQSIASYSLFQLLKEQQCPFTEQSMTVVFADGVRRTEKILTCKIPIVIQERTIEIDMLVLPTCTNNRTLLGIDFLEKAGIILNIPLGKWHFIDSPTKEYTFQKSDFSTTELQLAAAEILTTLRSEEGTLLSSSERSQLDDLLAEYQEIFQPSQNATKFAEHRIDTGDHAPIAVPPYRMPEAKKQVLQTEIEDMLENGVIEECESPWAAPVVLVPKKNGQVRVCIDYRKLNSITVGDSYPLPRLDDLLHEAKRTPYMSTIDLRAGYWQVSVRECDRDKTAFVTPTGMYRFNRMPFGLRNAPATFQRLVDRFRTGLGNVTILAYLDDLIILSETFQDHLRDLKLVFERLKLFELKANRDKCFFAKSSVKFLGHEITSSGIKTDPNKVAAIANRSVPQNVKELISFLQTCSWYRRFVPNFAKLAKPLTELTKKCTSWIWTEPQQEAFDTLKKLLTTAPILRQADGTLPYILRTDASNYALGACLLQGEGPEERPIEYASRLLTGAERNYNTSEREALAVIWAVSKFRGYLDCAHVIVCTDHQALKWLMSLKTPSGRLARWALLLQSYDLEIRYTPGKQNVIADTLSRPPQNDTQQEETSLCTINIELPSYTPRQIREEQLKDPDVKKIIDAFEKEEDPVEFTRWTNRGYIMQNGVLYRYNPDIDVEDAQLVVPEQQRNDVLKEYHDESTAGHYGVECTYQRLSTRFYWPGMHRFITNYIKHCTDCQRYKVTNQKPAGLLQTPVLKQRFETIAIDLFGPLPATTKREVWVFIVVDTATKWVELFPLQEATALECAKTLVREVILRYGTPRQVISDNGTQFTSAVMQHVSHCLGFKQSLVPVYHPSANPVERQNRDLKTQLAILVRDDHSTWSEHLAAIRFAMNTHNCQTTGHSAAYLVFGSEPRSPDDVRRDLRAIVKTDNFNEQITPYLLKIATRMRTVRETFEREQDKRKTYADTHKRAAPPFKIGDQVLVATHVLSDKKKGFTSKLAPRRDGPYSVMKQVSPTSYAICNTEEPQTSIGVYHTSQLTPFVKDDESEVEQPVLRRRGRGRPKKHENRT